MPYLFGIAIFLSASLLFIMELMYVKMVLPLLGGTPAVWNTCSMSFQFALLIGYLYAHASASKLKPKVQVGLHIPLLIVSLALLPVAIPAGWKGAFWHNPVLWLLTLMTITVGLPFTVISTNSPLLQKWFGYTGHKESDDPYFLYAASNAGSFAGLLGYLVLIEPRLSLHMQNVYWKEGYIILTALIAICGILTLFHSRDSAGNESSDVHDIRGPLRADITLGRMLSWVLLAFIPSSLTLGLTTHLTTDIASVPFLWVIPLSLYLLSLVVAFSKHQFVPQWLLIRLLPLLVLIQTVILVDPPLSLIWLIMIPLPTFFVAAWACHRQLVIDRPLSNDLTLFYLMISLGGVLGGMLNAVLAPMIFNSIAEYPIMLVVACIACLIFGLDPGSPERSKSLKITYADSLWIFGTAAYILIIMHFASKSAQGLGSPVIIFWLGVAAIVCFLMVDRPIRFGAMLATLLLVIAINPFSTEMVLYKNRSFFGVVKVEHDPHANVNRLIHGTTLHGTQSMNPRYSAIPLTYYYPTGPIGKLFKTFSGRYAKHNIAVVGLGTGTIAAYTGAWQHLTFYEIDDNIRYIAQNPAYFTYITDARARGAHVSVIMGDARLKIAEAPKSAYDIIILDAFSSDSIPTHLCTKQALAIYMSKLRNNGIIVFHLSNRYLNLDPIFGNLVLDAGLCAFIDNDTEVSNYESLMGKAGSRWLVAARHRADFLTLPNDHDWAPVTYDKTKPVWTDDFSNIYCALKWNI